MYVLFSISGCEILRIHRELPAVATYLNGNTVANLNSALVKIQLPWEYLAPFCLETSQPQLYHVARLFAMATMQLYFISLPAHLDKRIFACGDILVMLRAVPPSDIFFYALQFNYEIQILIIKLCIYMVSRKFWPIAFV